MIPCLNGSIVEGGILVYQYIEAKVAGISYYFDYQNSMMNKNTKKG